MNGRIQITSIILLLYGLVACNGLHSDENNIHDISGSKDIKEIKTIMPLAEGFDQFETYCIACHSLRYIQMQPDFPPKKWEVIVDKMIKNFGAPIPDSTAKQIVAYLSEVKGIH